MGVSSFTENPLSLRLLREAVASEEQWPETRYSVFDEGIRNLSKEHAPEREARFRPSEVEIRAATATASGDGPWLSSDWLGYRRRRASADPLAYLRADLIPERSLVHDAAPAVFRGVEGAAVALSLSQAPEPCRTRHTTIRLPFSASGKRTR